MDLDLNCANLSDNGQGVEIPPKHAKQYPTKINAKAIKEYIAKGGEILVIPAEKDKKNDKKVEIKKDKQEETLENSI